MMNWKRMKIQAELHALSAGGFPSYHKFSPSLKEIFLFRDAGFELLYWTFDGIIPAVLLLPQTCDDWCNAPTGSVAHISREKRSSSNGFLPFPALKCSDKHGILNKLFKKMFHCPPQFLLQHKPIYHGPFPNYG